MLVPACTSCLLFLHVSAASVTCFSADINCFQSMLQKPAFMAAPCSRCKLFSPQLFFKFMIASHALRVTSTLVARPAPNDYICYLAKNNVICIQMMLIYIYIYILYIYIYTHTCIYTYTTSECIILFLVI